MPETVNVPIEGGNVKQGITWTRGADGKLVPAQTAATPAPSPEQAPAQPSAETAKPAEPPRELTPLEEFHPSLDPSKVQITWDETTGKMRVIPREAAAVADEAVGDDTGDNLDHPSLGQQIAGQEQQQQTAQPSSEIAELKTQLSQMAQILTAVVTGQANGKSIAEALGVQPEPAVPTPPNPADYNLYDSESAAEFHRKNAEYNQQMIQQGIQAALAPHLPAITNARQFQEFESVKQTYSTDPNFENKAKAARQLVQANSSLSMEQAFKIVSHIDGVVNPKAQSSKNNAAATNGGTQKPARTITAEQANQLAEKAKKLPGNSGVAGAGPAPPPAHIKKLGQRMLWNLQQASAQN